MANFEMKIDTMNISVELTLTPIQDNYEPAIINFIKKMRDSGLTVTENPLTTRVYGAYDAVVVLLNKEIKNAFEAIDRGRMYVKIVKSDRSEYAADF